ncbi:MAG: hypothetical protein DRJ18_03070 [Candidatus Methanomethylicota archaeon]|nr:MAG: hypothetical protein DRJ18_03070 [Candidatus Verstraetearchaeota archaeon]
MILGIVMKVKIECKDYEKVRLPYPLSKIVAALSTYKNGIFILDPREALLTIYEAKRECEKALRNFIGVIANYGRIVSPATSSAMDIRKYVEIKAEPLFPIENRAEHILIVHIPRESREFEVDEGIGELIWIKGDTIMTAMEFIKRIAWAVVYYGIDLGIVAKLIKLRKRSGRRRASFRI